MKWSKTTLPDGIGLLAFSGFLVIGAMQVSLKNWNNVGISPRAFPYFLAACIALMGIMLVLGGIRARKKAGAALGMEQRAKEPYLLFRKTSKIHPSLFMVVLAVIYQILWKPIGFLIVTPVFMWIILSGFGMKPKRAAVITVGVVGVIYLAFTFGFKVTLPEGILRGIL